MTTTENTVSDHEAYLYARGNQGFVGDYADWQALSAEERAKYEAGAAGIPTS